MSEMTEIECVNQRCRRKVALIKPTAEVIQGNKVSLFVFSHGDMQRCPACGQGYVPLLKDISGVNFIWRAAQADPDPVVLHRAPSTTHPT